MFLLDCVFLLCGTSHRFPNPQSDDDTVFAAEPPRHDELPRQMTSDWVKQRQNVARIQWKFKSREGLTHQSHLVDDTLSCHKRAFKYHGRDVCAATSQQPFVSSGCNQKSWCQALQRTDSARNAQHWSWCSECEIEMVTKNIGCASKWTSQCLPPTTNHCAPQRYQIDAREIRSVKLTF